MELKDIHEALLDFGPTTPARLRRILQMKGFEISESQLTGRLRYGARVRALTKTLHPGHHPTYAANPNWRPDNRQGRGRRPDHEKRARVIQLRDGPDSLSWSEIGKRTGQSGPAAASMYKRAKQDQAVEGQPPTPKEDYSVIGS